MLEDICISLETAKRLVEAGIKIKTCFYWVKKRSDNATVYNEYYLSDSWDDFIHESIYPAPTAEEIERFITKDFTDTHIIIEAQYCDGMVETICKLYYPYPDKNIKHESKSKAENLAEIALEIQENSYLKGD